MHSKVCYPCNYQRIPTAPSACSVSFQQLSLHGRTGMDAARRGRLCSIYPLCYLEWLMVHSLPSWCFSVPHINYTLQTNKITSGQIIYVYSRKHEAPPQRIKIWSTVHTYCFSIWTESNIYFTALSVGELSSMTLYGNCGSSSFFKQKAKR
jgi:hypothetical protein